MHTLSVLPKISYSSASKVHTVEKNPFGGLFILNLNTSALCVWLLQRQTCRLQRNSSPPPPPPPPRITPILFLWKLNSSMFTRLFVKWMYCCLVALKDLASACMFFCGWLSQGVTAVHVRQSSLRREYISGHYKCSASRVNSNHSLWKENSVTTDNVSSAAKQRLSHVVNGPRDTGQFTKFPQTYWDVIPLRRAIFLCKLFFILTNCFVGKICLDNWFLGSSTSLEISLWVPGTVWICLVGSKMVEKLLCRFQERCRGALWDSDRFRNCFLRSRIVLELLCGLQAWLINRFFCDPR